MTHLFASRKGHLDYRINRDYIRNGVAVIPCQISGYSDVISTYSVKDYEILNPEFVEYIRMTADVIPDDYPLVLDIIGGRLSDEEQRDIEDTIVDEFAYSLGIVEKNESQHKKTFCFMFIGLIISGILLWLTQSFYEVPRELIVIIFYFMGDTLCDYIFLTGHDIRRERRLTGRLASIKVFFSEAYEGNDYTKSDVEELYSKIEEDVHRTIHQKEDEQ